VSLTAVDVHGFGGGFTLGVVQAGFELVGKMSRVAGFGVYNTLANRHLLGDKWESIAAPPEQWEVVDADVVFGNPPCSGFSTLSRKDFRGTSSSINDYMWELIRYAGRVKPQVVVWESVQQTFKQGLELMRQLHDELEAISGLQYTLTHVLHNNLSHGGVSMRKRYFWVASRVPFGVDYGRVTRSGEFADLDYLPTLGDMLRDLEPLGLTMIRQPYRGTRVAQRLEVDPATGEVLHLPGEVRVTGASLWTEREAHDGTGFVDGHDTYHSKTLDRTKELLDLSEVPWEQGENMSTVLRRYYQKNGFLPKSWSYMTSKVDDKTGERVTLPKYERLVETDFAMGHSQPFRWFADRPANVITGGAVHNVVHPHLDRLITHREAARIQGFPDDWVIWPQRHAPDMGPGWGKGVPVQAGRWIARWVRAALEGEPGPLVGVPLSQYNRKLGDHYGPRDREFVVNTTFAFRKLTESVES